MSAWVWVAVAAVGGAGATARFLADALIGRRARGSFPVGTLAINLTGAFGLGLLTGFATAGTTMVIAGTATLGSYTTFSTWMLETHRLAEDGGMREALANVILSIGLGVAAAAIGRTIAAHA